MFANAIKVSSLLDAVCYNNKNPLLQEMVVIRTCILVTHRRVEVWRRRCLALSSGALKGSHWRAGLKKGKQT